MGTNVDEIQKLLERRNNAINSITASVKHLELVEIVGILTSFLSIEEVENLAKFQKRG